MGRTLTLCIFDNFVHRLLQICSNIIQSIVNTWWKIHLVIFSTFDSPSSWNNLTKKDDSIQSDWGTKTKWPLKPPFYIRSWWNLVYCQQWNGQICLPILNRIGQKNIFHIVGGHQKACCMEVIYFSNVFQFDGVSKVENTTKWNFHQVFTIDWILCVQICSNLGTKLSKKQSFKVRHVHPIYKIATILPPFRTPSWILKSGWLHWILNVLVSFICLKNSLGTIFVSLSCTIMELQAIKTWLAAMLDLTHFDPLPMLEISETFLVREHMQ